MPQRHDPITNQPISDDGRWAWDGDVWQPYSGPAESASPMRETAGDAPPSSTRGTPMTPPAPTALGAIDTPLPGPRRAGPAWYRKGWVLAGATGLVGLIIGIGIGAAGGDVTTTPQYKKVAEQRDAARSNLDSTKSDLDSTKSDLASTQSDLGTTKSKIATIQGQIPARERAVTKREADVKAHGTALRKKEASVSKREKAVGIVETEIAHNTISGEGIFKVGMDMKTGTYKTSGAAGCYYAILNSTDTSDIADNNNIDGPAFVTVHDGQYFQTTRCADWILQR